MTRKTLALRVLVVGALAAFGLLTAAEIASAQGANVASGTAGASGPVTALNANTVTGGPLSAGGLGGVAATQLTGDTNTVVNQNTAAESGPAAAGSQVSTPGAGSTTQKTNVSSGSVAVSGPVVATTASVVQSGPSSVAAGPGSVAAASQKGDVNTYVEQNTLGVSGPATAGSQISTGGLGDAVSTGVNVSRNDFAFSGGVAVTNLLASAAGPTSVGIGGTAITGQVGDDDAYLSQSAIGASGGAVSGSQVSTDPLGSVGGLNVSSNNGAVSGPVATGNALGSVAGPSSLALGLGSISSATHTGDTSVVGNQVVGAATGNAVTGSQVYGFAAAEQGVVDVPNQQASDPDFQLPFSDVPAPTTQEPPAPTAPAVPEPVPPALGLPGSPAAPTTPDPTGLNGLLGIFGQIQNALGGSVNQVVSGLLGLFTGGLTPSAPVNGTTLPPLATAPGGITMPSTTTQGTGQASSTPSGFAPMTGGFQGSSPSPTTNGTQTAGGLGSNGSTSTGTQSNGTTGTGSTGTPGLTQGTGTTGTGTTPGLGTENLGTGLGALGAANPAAGLTGTRVNGTNVTNGNLGFTGASTAFNAGLATAGPGSRAVAVSDPVAAILPGAGDAIATTGMTGNADTTFTQVGGSVSGDAHVASQVAGDNSGTPLGIISDTNVANFNVGGSGSSGSLNVGSASSGPQADALSVGIGPFAGRAVASGQQFGNDTTGFTQRVGSISGDAVSGSQVHDSVGVVLSLNTNIATLGAAFSGPSGAANIGQATSGPDADAFSASIGLVPFLTADSVSSASQWGNDASLFTQNAASFSGDALTGSQRESVLGAATLNDLNVSTLGLATSGPAATLNLGEQGAGPSSEATSLGAGAIATSGQVGDNAASGSQNILAISGDGLAGSQDLASAGAVVSSERNVSLLAIALGGGAAAANVASQDTGPIAVSRGDALSLGGGSPTDAIAASHQLGNNGSRWTQGHAAVSGDALAGSQGNELLAGGLLLDTNIAVGSLAISGNARVLGFIDGTTGPAALADAGSLIPVVGLGDAAAFATQFGDNLSFQNQVGGSLSGDAVSGGQLRTGLFAASGPTLNASALSFAGSGDANAVNALGSQIGTTAAARPVGAVDAIAASTQVGPNVLVSNQVAGSVSGDAAAGSQLFTGAPLLFGGVNVALASFALTAPANGANAALATAGTPALSLGGVAVAAQLGGNLVNLFQLFSSRTGDVLIGSTLDGIPGIIVTILDAIGAFFTSGPIALADLTGPHAGLLATGNPLTF